MRKSLLLAAAGLAFMCFLPSASALPESCGEGSTCTVELPGAQCGDGTPMFMNVTRRAGATRLYLYLQGGGACWDALTCGCDWFGNCSGGTAARLTRPEPAEVRSGWRDASRPGNPITADYSVVEVPYCTGDLFMGNKQQAFGGGGAGLRQFGYHNLTVALDAVKKLFPEPKSVVFMGSSAGGLGATFNLHQVSRTYPDVPLSLIADSGTPFKAPFVNKWGMDGVIDSWSLRDNVPSDYSILVPGPLDLAGILKYNALRYPEHNYALISSYDDLTMNTFAVLVGTAYGFYAVHGILDDVADHDLGPKQKVFYVPGNRHTFHTMPFADVVVGSVNLGDWLGSMLGDQSDWTDQRADPGRNFPVSAP